MQSEVIARFSDLYALMGEARDRWIKARALYAEPAAFRAALQEFARGLGEVIEALCNRAGDIPDFDNWFRPYRQRFAQDPLMRWLDSVRENGRSADDFAANSRLVVELVASYAAEPLATWVPDLESSIEQIFGSVPTEIVDAHVYASGALCIARRWVDSALPDREVAEVASAANEQLQALLLDLLDHCGAALPPPQEDLGTRLGLDDPSVGEEDRLYRSYIGLGSGHVLALDRERPLPTEGLIRRAARRFQGSALEGPLQTARTWADVASAFFADARHHMLQHGYFQPVAVFMSGNQVLDVQEWEPRDRAEKYAVVREMARYARLAGADGVFLVFESWILDSRRPPVGASATRRDAMAEALVLVGADAGGTVRMLQSTIRRPLFRRSKVKQMGEAVPITGLVPALLVPFLAVWGKADVLAGPDVDLTRDFHISG